VNSTHTSAAAESVADQMRRLAEALAVEHALDFTLASLSKLDALAARRPLDDHELRALAAYLGEVVRRVAPAAFEWAADAAAPVLVGGGARWFVLGKVEKRHHDGPRDDLFAFGGAMIAMTPGAAARMSDAESRVRAEQMGRYVTAAVVAFRADPAGKTLDTLAHTLYGRDALCVDALRATGLNAHEIFPLIGAPPSGRGRARIDPGQAAARVLVRLVQLELAAPEVVVATLRPRIHERNKIVRENVARVLASIDASQGSALVAIDLSGKGDRALTAGVIAALRDMAVDAGSRECALPFALDLVVPILAPALAPTSAHLRPALAALDCWLERQSGAAHCLLPALKQLRFVGKSSVALTAERVAYLVGRAPDVDPGSPRLDLGYAGTFEAVGGAASYTMTFRQLSLMRELMREVGALADSRERALTDGPPTDAAAPPFEKFACVGSTFITPVECRVIATRLCAYFDEVILEMASFFDDAPSTHEVRAWVDAWSDFNLRAAELGGYRLR
jgi:hypothetical protein